MKLQFLSAALLAVYVSAQADSCGSKYKSQSTCDAASGCVWCKCAALPSACWTTADAKKLPSGVYDCDSSYNTTTDYHASNMFAVHGPVDGKHCYEHFVPRSQVRQFLKAGGNYTRGLCQVPYTTYEGKPVRDAKFPGVVHMKRGIDLKDTNAKITLTDCATSPKISGLKWTVSPADPAKGSTTTIQGTGDLTEEVNGGDYTIVASYGSITLVNQKTSNCESASISLPLGIGTVKANAFQCPQSTGSVSVSVELPVPNLQGSVTATASSVDASGAELFCVKMSMAL